jgi:hypothetical protein
MIVPSDFTAIFNRVDNTPQQYRGAFKQHNLGLFYIPSCGP